jgi:hypothetical protein
MLVDITSVFEMASGYYVRFSVLEYFKKTNIFVE